LRLGVKSAKLKKIIFVTKDKGWLSLQKTSFLPEREFQRFWASWWFRWRVGKEDWLNLWLSSLHKTWKGKTRCHWVYRSCSNMVGSVCFEQKEEWWMTCRVKGWHEGHNEKTSISKVKRT
jgi:hypothetical protein